MTLLEWLGGWPVLDENWDRNDLFNWIELVAKLRLLNNRVLINNWVSADDRNSDVNIIQVKIISYFGDHIFSLFQFVLYFHRSSTSLHLECPVESTTCRTTTAALCRATPSSQSASPLCSEHLLIARSRKWPT